MKRVHSLLFDAGLRTAAFWLALGTVSAEITASASNLGEKRTPTLQERIDAAIPGDVISLSSGSYAGPVRIDKPLTLDGAGHAEIDGGGSGVVVRVTAAGVVLRGLHITASGVNLSADDAGIHISADEVVVEDCVVEDSLHGIYLHKASRCRIERNVIRGKTVIPSDDRPAELGLGASPADCVLVQARRGNGIHQWNCRDNRILDNRVSEARDGIYFSFTSGSHCEGNHVFATRYGLHYMYSDDNTISGNVFENNVAGAAIMFSRRFEVRDNRFAGSEGFRAYGVILQSVEDSRIESNLVERNAVGLSFNQCSRNRVVANRVVRNFIGLRFGSNSDENNFSANLFTRNLHTVELAGDNGTNRWAVAGIGNHWGGAALFDPDGDGISNLPHRETDLFGSLRRDFPEVSLLSASPAIGLLRFANQRAALPGLRAVEDPAPLSAAVVRRFHVVRKP